MSSSSDIVLVPEPPPKRKRVAVPGLEGNPPGKKRKLEELRSKEKKEKKPVEGVHQIGNLYCYWLCCDFKKCGINSTEIKSIFRSLKRSWKEKGRRGIRMGKKDLMLYFGGNLLHKTEEVAKKSMEDFQKEVVYHFGAETFFIQMKDSEATVHNVKEEQAAISDALQKLRKKTEENERLKMDLDIKQKEIGTTEQNFVSKMVELRAQKKELLAQDKSKANQLKTLKTQFVFLQSQLKRWKELEKTLSTKQSKEVETLKQWHHKEIAQLKNALQRKDSESKQKQFDVDRMRVICTQRLETINLQDNKIKDNQLSYNQSMQNERRQKDIQMQKLSRNLEEFKKKNLNLQSQMKTIQQNKAAIESTVQKLETELTKWKEQAHSTQDCFASYTALINSGLLTSEEVLGYMSCAEKESNIGDLKVMCLENNTVPDVSGEWLWSLVRDKVWGNITRSRWLVKVVRSLLMI